MSKITQSQVNEAVLKTKNEWDRLVKESGKSETMYIALSSEATVYLAQYEEVKQRMTSEGFTIPDLVEGVTVTLS